MGEVPRWPLSELTLYKKDFGYKRSREGTKEKGELP